MHAHSAYRIVGPWIALAVERRAERPPQQVAAARLGLRAGRVGRSVRVAARRGRLGHGAVAEAARAVRAQHRVDGHHATDGEASVEAARQQAAVERTHALVRYHLPTGAAKGSGVRGRLRMDAGDLTQVVIQVLRVRVRSPFVVASASSRAVRACRNVDAVGLSCHKRCYTRACFYAGLDMARLLAYSCTAACTRSACMASYSARSPHASGRAPPSGRAPCSCTA
eukprot:6180590-Pleurochrysis_carterae.AAC.4